MPRLIANVYGGSMLIDSVVEYGEHEVSIAGGPYERVRYARCMLKGIGVIQFDLRDLSIEPKE